ncbi:DMT family transporter [Aquamicrobium zhengzhouense]|uniref:DMT family transporter n=1 Tax=Aquamicrobium zhengzhouense TaxID=2781738 RepID=A0ABS0SCI1_9HYPH|nr:DMT family transporter [Aquamicrobium zhengzhouense]MBI1621004.1 DMT family transporter [Aquamicrobium zhengzhouense]
MSDNYRGALFMTLAMFCFALEDMALKAAVQEVPVGQAILIFGIAGTLVFTLIARASSQPALHPAITSPVMLLRSLSEICGRLFYSVAIALTTLSSVSAILQATPLIVALGAVLFFNEKVGLSRWTAIAVGFVGVLFILRPGVDGFEPASIFAVLGTLGFAGRDLATRASPVSMTTAQLGVLGFSVLSVSGLILLAWSGEAVWPTARAWALLALTTAVGCIAYGALTRAMRSGDISVVAAFRYSRLLFAFALGIFVFNERPDLLTYIGCVIVVGSGIALLRSPRTSRTEAGTASPL